jgi:hypothetical protein
MQLFWRKINLKYGKYKTPVKLKLLGLLIRPSFLLILQFYVRLPNYVLLTGQHRA